MSAVKIKQVRSLNGANPKQKATLKALGLGGIGKAVERKDSCTRPRAIASITLLTPCERELRKRAMVPATPAATTGTIRRIHRGSFAIDSTTFSAP